MAFHGIYRPDRVIFHSDDGPLEDKESYVHRPSISLVAYPSYLEPW